MKLLTCGDLEHLPMSCTYDYNVVCVCCACVCVVLYP